MRNFRWIIQFFCFINRFFFHLLYVVFLWFRLYIGIHCWGEFVGRKFVATKYRFCFDSKIVSRLCVVFTHVANVGLTLEFFPFLFSRLVLVIYVHVVVLSVVNSFPLPRRHHSYSLIYSFYATLNPAFYDSCRKEKKKREGGREGKTHGENTTRAFL